jgi:hypothetical protein
MKTKKYLIAIAIFGGMLFTAEALTDNGQPTDNIEKSQIRVPTLG